VCSLPATFACGEKHMAYGEDAKACLLSSLDRQGAKESTENTRE